MKLLDLEATMWLVKSSCSSSRGGQKKTELKRLRPKNSVRGSERPNLFDQFG